MIQPDEFIETVAHITVSRIALPHVRHPFSQSSASALQRTF
jgi:hypothetical protein